MTDLSPAAQAVLDTATNKWLDVDDDIPASVAAAALRALADQLGQDLEFYNCKVIEVDEILAIAAELEDCNG